MLIKGLIFIVGFLIGMLSTAVVFGTVIENLKSKIESLEYENRKILSDAIRRKQNKIDELRRELKRARREKRNKK